MDVPGDFFTRASLLTFGGATAATFVVPNALQAAFGFNPRWLALAVAELICLAVVASAHGGPIEYLIALVNGCLVFCSAAGATTITGRGDHLAAAPTRPAIHSLMASEATRSTTVRRGFLTPWF